MTEREWEARRVKSDDDPTAVILVMAAIVACVAIALL